MNTIMQNQKLLEARLKNIEKAIAELIKITKSQEVKVGQADSRLKALEVRLKVVADRVKVVESKVRK